MLDSTGVLFANVRNGLGWRQETSMGQKATLVLVCSSFLSAEVVVSDTVSFMELGETWNKGDLITITLIIVLHCHCSRMEDGFMTQMYRGQGNRHKMLE